MFGRRSSRYGGAKLSGAERSQASKVEKLVDLATSQPKGDERFGEVTGALSESSQAVVREIVRHLRKRLHAKDVRHVFLALKLADRVVVEVASARAEAGAGPGGKKFCEAVMRVALETKNERVRSEARAIVVRWAEAYASQETSLPYFATTKVEMLAALAASGVAVASAPESHRRREPPVEAEEEEEERVAEEDNDDEDTRLARQARSMSESLVSVKGADAETIADAKSQCERVLSSVRGRVAEIASADPPREALIQTLIAASEELAAKLESLDAPAPPPAASLLELDEEAPAGDRDAGPKTLDELFGFAAPASPPEERSSLGPHNNNPSSPFDSMLMRRKHEGFFATQSDVETTRPQSAPLSPGPPEDASPTSPSHPPDARLEQHLYPIADEAASTGDSVEPSLDAAFRPADATTTSAGAEPANPDATTTTTAFGADPSANNLVAALGQQQQQQQPAAGLDEGVVVSKDPPPNNNDDNNNNPTIESFSRELDSAFGVRQQPSAVGGPQEPSANSPNTTLGGASREPASSFDAAFGHHQPSAGLEAATFGGAEPSSSLDAAFAQHQPAASLDATFGGAMAQEPSSSLDAAFAQQQPSANLAGSAFGRQPSTNNNNNNNNSDADAPPTFGMPQEPNPSTGAAFVGQQQLSANNLEATLGGPQEPSATVDVEAAAFGQQPSANLAGTAFGQQPLSDNNSNLDAPTFPQEPNPDAASAFGQQTPSANNLDAPTFGGPREPSASLDAAFGQQQPSVNNLSATFGAPQEPSASLDVMAPAFGQQPSANLAGPAFGQHPLPDNNSNLDATTASQEPKLDAGSVVFGQQQPSANNLDATFGAPQEPSASLDVNAFGQQPSAAAAAGSTFGQQPLPSNNSNNLDATTLGASQEPKLDAASVFGQQQQPSANSRDATFGGPREPAFGGAELGESRGAADGAASGLESAFGQPSGFSEFDAAFSAPRDPTLASDAVFAPLATDPFGPAKHQKATSDSFSSFATPNESASPADPSPLVAVPTEAPAEQPMWAPPAPAFEDPFADIVDDPQLPSVKADAAKPQVELRLEPSSPSVVSVASTSAPAPAPVVEKPKDPFGELFTW